MIDFPLLDFNVNKDPWKTLFLGLISPHANKYQSYMLNTINNIKSLKEKEQKEKDEKDLMQLIKDGGKGNRFKS